MNKKSNSFNLDLFRKTYQGPTVRVKLVVAERKAAYLPTTPFTSSSQVANYFSPLEEEPREVLIAMYLDNKHRALGIEEVSKGTLTSSLCEPRAILQGAILANAAAVILVHNHPSGQPAPSPEDIAVTKRLKELADLLPIRLLDHVIIGRKTYYSLVDNGGI
jgi:DNA repair protein RadC